MAKRFEILAVLALAGCAAGPAGTQVAAATATSVPVSVMRATTGGNAEAWADSIREVTAFFRRHLGPR